MTTSQLLWSAWAWEPSVVVGCAALAGGYLALARPLTARAWYFFAGVAVLLFSLVSPLDVLGDGYLFSAHMAQHLLLILVVPPLLLLGLPATAVRRTLGRLPGARIGRLLVHPVVAWALATGIMFVWHLPALYDLAVRDERIHVAQHLLFLGSATLFWWPVVDPGAAPGEPPLLPPWASLVYLFAAFGASSLLGIILTFAPAGLYPVYVTPDDHLGILPLLREGWGLSVAADQQLGGLLMWVAGGAFYLLPIIAVFGRWMSEPEAEEASAPDPSRTEPALVAARTVSGRSDVG